MALPFNPREVLAAARDAVAMAVGARVDQPHPLAEGLTLRKIAVACGEISKPRMSFENDLAVMGRGMATSDFAKILADGVAQITIATYGSQAEHNAFTDTVEVANFKPAALPALDGDMSLEPLGENAEIQRGYAFLAAGAAREVSLTTFARAVVISRESIINDELGGISKVLATLGASAARLESRMVSDALEENPALDDGREVFHADHMNVVAAALDAIGLGQAMALLRTQPTSAGLRADLRARHLVVAPDLEYVANRLIVESSLDVKVSSLANLPNGRWFLMADKVGCPTVATLRLQGAKLPVRVESRRGPIKADGAGVRVIADLGACMLRRTGIVRGGV